MKRIAIATDFSLQADRAFDRAVDMARYAGAELLLINVIGYNVPAHEADKEADKAYARMQGMVGDIDGDVPPIDITIQHGTPSEEIVAAMTAFNAELLVMGMHHKDVLKNLFVGTTLDRVIRHSPAPVLVAKDKVRGPYRNILTSVDFSECSGAALRLAVRMFPGATHAAVNVYDMPFTGLIRPNEQTREAYAVEHRQDIESEMRRFLGDVPGIESIDLPVSLIQDQPAAGIMKAIDEYEPDLLVMGSHGRNAAKRAILGSVVQSVLNNPPVDVLVTKKDG